jgi:hypothetical protein
MIMKIFLFIISLVLINACSNPKKLAVVQIPPFKPEVKVYKCEDSLNIYVTMAELNNKKDGKRDFLKSIKSTEANFYFGKHLVQHIKLKDFLITKVLEDSNEVMLYGGIGRFAWPNPKTRTHDMNVEIKIYSSNGIYAMKTKYPKIVSDFNVQCNNALDLIPWELKTGNSQYLLGIAAFRRNTVEDEYIPSSEDFRAEIFSYKGKLLWSSNFNINYMQQIMKVKPVENYKANLYSVIWDGKTNNKKNMRSGDYKIKLLIPTKPKPYFIMKDFMPELEW